MRGGVHQLPECVFMAWCLVKHRDNFTFIFTLRLSFRSFSFAIIGEMSCVTVAPDASFEIFTAMFHVEVSGLSVCLTKYQAMKTYLMLN
jgi:hypothetical protein